jgi:hypothetical protein
VSEFDNIRGDSPSHVDHDKNLDKDLDEMLHLADKPLIPEVKKKPASTPEQILNQPAAAKVAAEVAGRPLTREEQVKMLNDLPDDLMAEFTKRVLDAVKAASPSPSKPETAVPSYITDFSNIQERDIFNMDLPINPIVHEIPDFLTVTLKDANFVARWIHTNSRRLGEVLAQGFTYVVEEDLGTDLNIEVDPDASGHFIYADTVLMKLPKSKYYGKLRSNFQRAVAMTRSASAIHEKMKNAIESELASGQYAEDFLKYKGQNQMNTYSPLVGA